MSYVGSWKKYRTWPEKKFEARLADQSELGVVAQWAVGIGGGAVA